MNTKDLLKSYNWLKKDTQELWKQREAILAEEAMPSGIDYSADRVQTSPDDGMFRKMMRIEERTADIDRRIAQQVQMIQAIDNALNDMPDKKLKKLLKLKYFEKKGWRYVAGVIGYTEDHTKGYLHGTALEMFAKNLKVNTF